MDLINKLVAELGISEAQAKGGVGALLEFAKNKLAEGDFSQILAAIPGADGLLAKAPAAEAGAGAGAGGFGGGGFGGLLGGVAAVLGSDTKLGGLAELGKKFSAIGLDASHLQKFAPMVLAFAKEHGGPQVEAALKKVLS